MLWINFLHFYQPANIESYKIKEALDKSYWRLVRLMEEHPNLKMTWNISGCLLERLDAAGEKEFISRVKALVASGQVELTGSAAYHALLPLIPLQESVRQVEENSSILKKYFGQDISLKGFFLPEMAYSKSVAAMVKDLGYDWIILDERHLSEGRVLSNEKKYKDTASGLGVVFRNRQLSASYPPDKLLDEADSSDRVYITATDAELYGLRHQDPTAAMENIAADEGVKTLTISEYRKSLKDDDVVEVKINSASWESTDSEIKQQRPYELWSGRGNLIQSGLWKLANLAIEIGNNFSDDPNIVWYRWHLVRGLASCTFWWASGRDFTADFGPYAWSPDDIERGLEDLVRSVRSLSSLKSLPDKLRAEKYYLKIKKRIWREHWRRHWPTLVRMESADNAEAADGKRYE